MLFTKGAESAILPYATGGEIEKTRLHVDEFALVSPKSLFLSAYNLYFVPSVQSWLFQEKRLISGGFFSTFPNNHPLQILAENVPSHIFSWALRAGVAEIPIWL